MNSGGRGGVPTKPDIACGHTSIDRVMIKLKAPKTTKKTRHRAKAVNNETETRRERIGPNTAARGCNFDGRDCMYKNE